MTQSIRTGRDFEAAYDRYVEARRQYVYRRGTATVRELMALANEVAKCERELCEFRAESDRWDERKVVSQ